MISLLNVTQIPSQKKKLQLFVWSRFHTSLGSPPCISYIIVRPSINYVMLYVGGGHKLVTGVMDKGRMWQQDVMQNIMAYLQYRDCWQ